MEIAILLGMAEISCDPQYGGCGAPPSQSRFVAVIGVKRLHDGNRDPFREGGDVMRSAIRRVRSPAPVVVRGGDRSYAPSRWK
jgi:hypothetical protein